MPTLPESPDYLIAPVEGMGWQMLQIKSPNWQWCLGGDWVLTFNLYTESPPNRFQRLLLRWLLGIHWRRIGA